MDANTATIYVLAFLILIFTIVIFVLSKTLFYNYLILENMDKRIRSAETRVNSYLETVVSEENLHESKDFVSSVFHRILEEYKNEVKNTSAKSTGGKDE